MKYEQFSFRELEQEILEQWMESKLHESLDESGKKPFYFLDGPPYTSGKIHIGQAWNKTLKDVLVRYKRMTGHRVWNRAGYDMHGLPTEHATMKKLGLQTKEEIETYGVDRFIKECQRLAKENLLRMNKDFEALGISLDFENAYETMSDEWIEAAWWLMKKAHEEGRLYQGLRPMAWDPEHETACAKHELEYKQVEDTSIYVKFTRKEADEHFIIWTTTPWTIPFNLIIMVNPEMTYVRLKARGETWIVAKDLVDAVLEAAGTEGKIIEEVLGEDLVGLEYEHFFEQIIDYASIKKAHPKVHTLVASKEYVTAEHGTGLVHAAPGCGPEDYEVGVQEDVPAFNLLDERGVFGKEAGIFAGKRAREEDRVFIDEIHAHGHLVAEEQYVHDYPHAERSKAAVVYKTTQQWFFKVSDKKAQMIKQNDEVHWASEAAYNAFNSWLENLRDNSITKQRYWGTPFPVWINEEDSEDIIVVASRKELEELSGQEVPELHKPWIDEIEIEKDGKTYKRLPDVTDVWIDAGIASYACLHYPQQTEHFEELFPADFILEGNDQIRGWFNLLMVVGTIAFDKAPFKNVYMHGMINDTSGRKMSKSLGNYIRPEEVLSKYGADASRLYFTGGAKAGHDLNYNHDDVEQKHKNLRVYWNIHKYLLDLPDEEAKAYQIEDVYITKYAEQAVNNYREVMERYEIDRAPDIVEDLLQEISRTYIQLTRNREDQGTVRQVLATTYVQAIKMLAPISPFITEAIWSNLKKPLSLKEQSVHLATLPEASPIEEETIIEDFAHVKRIISVLLAARDKAQIGVRWPLPKASLNSKPLRKELQDLIKEQTNIKELAFTEELGLSYEIAPDYRTIGKEYEQETADIVKAIKQDQEKLAKQYAKEKKIIAAGHELGAEYLEVTPVAPEGHVVASDKQLLALLDTRQDEALLQEGYVRELIRRIQQLRKEAELDKEDRIHLVVDAKNKDLLSKELAEAVGAVKHETGKPEANPHHGTATVKDRTFSYGFSLVDKP